MRRYSPLVLAASLSLVACGRDAATGPLRGDDEVVISLEGSILGLTGSADGALAVAGNIPELPSTLALTDDQRAQITSLVDAHQQSVQADRAALAAVERRAIAARRAGAPADEVNAIRAEGHAIRTRIEESARQLRGDILSVLTPAQRDHVVSRGGGGDRRCDGGDRLTPEQQAEIQALIADFRSANAADRAIIEQAMRDARAARAAGKSEAEVLAILQTARDAQARLQAAHADLQAAIRAILTSGQRTSGCFAG
jgi:Spy/CpxP family protein refolding chaperone